MLTQWTRERRDQTLDQARRSERLDSPFDRKGGPTETFEFKQ